MVVLVSAVTLYVTPPVTFVGTIRITEKFPRASVVAFVKV